MVDLRLSVLCGVDDQIDFIVNKRAQRSIALSKHLNVLQVDFQIALLNICKLDLPLFVSLLLEGVWVCVQIPSSSASESRKSIVVVPKVFKIVKIFDLKALASFIIVSDL